MKKRDINDLYFGIKRYENGKLVTRNLFDSIRVRNGVAHWVLHHDKAKDGLDFSMFCFGSTWSRVEWEFAIGDIFVKSTEDLKKVDVFEMYVKPNIDILAEMVNSVSKSSAKKWLKEHKTVWSI